MFAKFLIAGRSSASTALSKQISVLHCLRGPESTKLEPTGATKQTAVIEPKSQQSQLTRPCLYPGEMDWLSERQVRISRPSKNVMQSGTAYTNSWKIEFNSEKRWQNWLMGWTSSADPLSNLSLNFPTKESAIEYCEQNNLHWFLEEQPERKIRRKSYADNFSWNKRTRLGNK